MSRRTTPKNRPIETWLEGMRTDRQRPIVRLVVNRDGRTPAYAFDVDEETDLDELARRIDTMCRSAGFKAYELHALDSDGREIESEAVELIVPHKPARAVPTTIDDAAALHALSEAARLQGQLLTALQTKKMFLLQEGAELRRLLARLEELKARLTAGPSAPGGPRHRKRGNRRHPSTERKRKGGKADPNRPGG